VGRFSPCAGAERAASLGLGASLPGRGVPSYGKIAPHMSLPRVAQRKPRARRGIAAGVADFCLVLKVEEKCAEGSIKSRDVL